MSRKLILFGSLLLGCLPVHAADDPNLSKLVDDWNAAKAKEDKKLLRSFDLAIAAIRKDRLTDVEVRNQQLERLQEQKKAFQTAGELPIHDDLLPAILAYLDALQRAAKPVRDNFAAELEATVGMGAKFDAVVAAKKAWEKQLPGTGELSARTEFHGTIRFVDRTTDVHVHVLDMDGSLFTCDLWRDVGNIQLKRGWRFQGKLDGNHLVLDKCETLHGPPVDLVLAGYAFERRLVMTVTSANGKPPKDPPLLSVWKK